MAFLGEKGSAAAKGAAFGRFGALATVVAVADADVIGSATSFGVMHAVAGVAKHVGNGIRYGVGFTAVLVAVGGAAGVGMLLGRHAGNGNVLFATKAAAVIAAFFHRAFKGSHKTKRSFLST